MLNKQFMIFYSNSYQTWMNCFPNKPDTVWFLYKASASFMWVGSNISDKFINKSFFLWSEHYLRVLAHCAALFFILTRKNVETKTDISAAGNRWFGDEGAYKRWVCGRGQNSAIHSAGEWDTHRAQTSICLGEIQYGSGCIEPTVVKFTRKRKVYGIK